MAVETSFTRIHHCNAVWLSPYPTTSATAVALPARSTHDALRAQQACKCAVHACSEDCRRARLHDAPALPHKHEVRSLERREAVCNEDDGEGGVAAAPTTAPTTAPTSCWHSDTLCPSPTGAPPKERGHDIHL